MSTRASIILKEGCTYTNPIYLYHHCDGYVEGVGYILRRVMKFHPFCYVEQVATDLVRMEDKYGSGFRVSNVLPDDIEYVYVIDGDSKTVVAYKRPSWVWPQTSDREHNVCRPSDCIACRASDW